MHALADSKGDHRCLAMDENVGWTAVNDVVDRLRLRKRSELMAPMRHALTGRRVRGVSSSKRSCA